MTRYCPRENYNIYGTSYLATTFMLIFPMSSTFMYIALSFVFPIIIVYSIKKFTYLECGILNSN